MTIFFLLYVENENLENFNAEKAESQMLKAHSILVEKEKSESLRSYLKN